MVVLVTIAGGRRVRLDRSAAATVGGYHESGAKQPTPLSAPAHPRRASGRQADREGTSRPAHKLLNGLTPAERQGLAIGLAGIARVLKNHH
jgi:hypothetical protein